MPAGLQRHDADPDAMELIAARSTGYDSSIAIEISIPWLRKNPFSAYMLRMLNRYAACRLGRVFPEKVLALLREPGYEFKLFGDATSGWKLFRARYEAPRDVTVSNGTSDAWTVNNPCDHTLAIAAHLSRSVHKAPEQFSNPSIYVGEQAITFPVKLGFGEVLVYDGPGGCALFGPDHPDGKKVVPVGAAPMLKPGRNRIVLSCDKTCKTTDISVRIFSLEPVYP